MASSNIAWICGQCTNKIEGSEPGPCHFCQAPHPKRKVLVVSVPTSAPALPNAVALLAVASPLPTKSACIHQPTRSSSSVIDLSAPDVVQVVASTSPAKPVCIGQPVCSSGSIIEPSAPDAVQAVASVSLAKAVRICQPAPSSSGSVIDLSAPDAALAVASASLTKPVFIHQPATRSSGSVIDLSTPDAALAAASALPAKPMFGLSSGIVIDIAGIDAVDENHVLTDQNLALAIVVGQLRSQEQEPAYRCRALEVLLDRKWSDNRSQRDVIHNLQTRLANNNANLISELQEY